MVELPPVVRETGLAGEGRQEVRSERLNLRGEQWRQDEEEGEGKRREERKREYIRRA